MATAKRDLTNPPVQGHRPSTGENLQILVPAEAAEFLRISVDQLYHLTSSKKVPFAKVGGSLRFDRGQLQEFVSNGGLQGNGSAARNGGDAQGCRSRVERHKIVGPISGPFQVQVQHPAPTVEGEEVMLIT